MTNHTPMVSPTQSQLTQDTKSAIQGDNRHPGSAAAPAEPSESVFVDGNEVATAADLMRPSFGTRSAFQTSDLVRFGRLSILIAAYNEEATLQRCIERILRAPLSYDLAREIILVDDGSTDNTWPIAQKLAAKHPELRIFRQPKNYGKGAAIRRAISEMAGDLAILQDADLEYDPADWPVLFEPLIDGRADACFGSRFLGGPHRVLYYWHSVGNRMLTTFSNMLTNLNLTDMETCYKAIRGDLARSLAPKLTADRFGFEPEITARLAKSDARIFEVPISYSGRTYAEGKKIGWKDGIAAFWHITKFNLFS